MLVAFVAGAILPTQVAGADPAPVASTTTPAPPATVAIATPTNSDSRNATFGVAPANSNRPDGRSSFTYAADPGAVVQDFVAVENLSSAPLTLDFYTADVVAGDNGSANLPPKDTRPVDAGTWITVDIPDHPSTITVAARTAVVVPFTVRIPNGVTPGDHVAGIIAALTTDAKTDKGDVVHVDQRVVARAQFRIGGVLDAHLAVEAVGVTYHQTANPFGRGDVDVTYTVRNTGNVRLAGHEQVGFDGLLRSHVDADPVPDLPVLLPGASVTETAHLADVWPQFVGWANITIDPTAVTGDADPQLGPVVEGSSVWALPLALIALVIALLVVWRVVRKVRRPKPAAAAGATTSDPDLDPDADADGSGVDAPIEADNDAEAVLS